MNLSKACCQIAAVILLAVTGVPAEQSPPDGIKFEVVSVKVLPEKEALERSPDYLGPNVAVRLRLETGSQGLSFYGWKNSAVPGDYRIERTNHGTIWFHGKAGKGIAENTQSPGLESVLFGSEGTWSDLPPHSAIEWEELDFTSLAGQVHAFTVFIKLGNARQALEISSDTFTVPQQAVSP